MNPIIKRYRRRTTGWIPLLCLALLLPALGGCGNAAGTPSATNESAGSGSGSGTKLQPLTVMLDWYPNAVHTFLYAAEEQGYFDEEGLDVTIQMPADSNDALKLVAAGKADLALSYQPQVLMARGEEIPVRSIAALVRHPLNHLLVPESGGIASPKDLSGHAVGFSSIPLYEAMLRAMVNYDGGDAASLNMIDVGYDLIPAVTTGRVEGIIGGFINHEALLLEKEGVPMTSFDPTDYGVPDYYELVLVASEPGLQQSQEAYAAFLRAARKGQQFTAEHPQEALDLLLAQQDATAPLERDIEARSLELLLPLMDAGKHPFGDQDGAVWEQVAEWLKQNGLLDSEVQSGDAFVNL
ncbi:ABC transporter substrate-binding protein [Paenibacillus tengchongensis]|uniref:ABC transporter substrate-binding protein n=1 Tax=Paenibacillus tengchongensis TaxID=2608684 RepID=UPI00124DDC89|nr:ABC transporter substrate-binding protein [Paenibacillus tengchongensis]